MDVSVVIPAHNAAATLAKAVASLQAQTAGEWQAVIVDDGSTDDTLALARRLAENDARLQVITQAQGGESTARNAGISAVRGDAVVFLDADDWLLPAYFERMLPVLAADPRIDVVYCGHYLVTSDGQRSPAVFPWWSTDLFAELCRRNPFAIHTCLARRTLVDALGPFDVGLRTASDWDFWQRAARLDARFEPVHEALACYLVRPGSATSNARQILADSLTIIARGHQPDPRVARPAARYARGRAAEHAPQARLYLACWAAGLAIGQGQAAIPLLDSISEAADVQLAPEMVAAYLFDAVPWPTGRLHTAWPELWPRVEAALDSFLNTLEARTGSEGLAQQAGAALRALVFPASSAAATGSLPALIPAGGEVEGTGSRWAEQQRYIAELEAAKVWLEQHAANWQQVAMQREQAIHDLKAWIDELEAAKSWLDEQRLNWMRRAATVERQLHRRLPLSWPRWLRPGLWRETEAEPSVAPHQPARSVTPLPAAPDRFEPTAPLPEATNNEEVDPPPAGALRPARTPGPFPLPRLVNPVSRVWGYDRGLPVDRYYIERFLARHAADVRGRVLEVGDNSYTLRFGGRRVQQSDVLNVAAGDPQTTIVADLAQGDALPSAAFDCLILTQTLQLIYDAPAALRTAARILRPGGTLLLTCPGLTRTSLTEWPGAWYWRFTPDSLQRLLAEAAPGLEALIESHGNVLAASAFLYGLAAEELGADELDHHDPEFDVIVAARAVKRGDAAAGPAQRRASAGRSEPEPRGVVLLYHRIGQSQADPWALSVTPERFDAQMGLLRRVFQPVRLTDMARALSRPPGGPPPVAVSFDDGYADNLYAALPILERHGVPATFFIVTGAVTHRSEFWWDTLERVLLWPGRLPETLQLNVAGQVFTWNLGRWADYSEADCAEHRYWRAWASPPTTRHSTFTALWSLLHPLPVESVQAALVDLADWAGLQAGPKSRAMGLDELRQLAASGLADLGGHTVTHPSLRPLALADQRAEIEASRRWLADVFGRAVPGFAYPFGKRQDFGPETIALVQSAGFEWACVSTPGCVHNQTDPFQLPRLHVTDLGADDFERELRTWLAG